MSNPDMSENLYIDKTSSDEEKYQALLPQIENLLYERDAEISKLANFTAALKQTFDKISWVGFYLADGDNLYLGPFQGKVACTNIKIGNGVCGNAARDRQTIIVSDINNFQGHISCDPDSRSEIVVPLVFENKLYGVLDLDSTEFNSFNETDKKYLEILSTILLKKLF